MAYNSLYYAMSWPPLLFNPVTKVSSLKGARPDIITMISAHHDQGSKDKLFPGKNSKGGGGPKILIT